jgi:hypothetical protein
MWKKRKLVENQFSFLEYKNMASQLTSSKSEILKDEELLDRVQKRIHKLRIPFISVGISEKKGKKLRLTLVDGHSVDFGARGSRTYLEQPNESKRKAYIARHSQIRLKDGSRAVKLNLGYRKVSVKYFTIFQFRYVPKTHLTIPAHWDTQVQCTIWCTMFQSCW